MVAKALNGKIPKDIADAAKAVKREFVDELNTHIRKSAGGGTSTNGSKPSGHGGSDTSQYPKDPTKWKAEDFARLSANMG
jgi:hypothetical protein